jgi:hypothetical protein
LLIFIKKSLWIICAYEYHHQFLKSKCLCGPGTHKNTQPGKFSLLNNVGLWITTLPKLGAHVKVIMTPELSVELAETLRETTFQLDSIFQNLLSLFCFHRSWSQVDSLSHEPFACPQILLNMSLPKIGFDQFPKDLLYNIYNHLNGCSLGCNNIQHLFFWKLEIEGHIEKNHWKMSILAYSVSLQAFLQRSGWRKLCHYHCFYYSLHNW